MSKRSISEVCDSFDDCSVAKKQSIINPIQPFGSHLVSASFICKVPPMTTDSTDCQRGNVRPSSPEINIIVHPPSPQWLELEDSNMEYPDNYPPSPISDVDDRQYGADSDDESIFGDIRYGSDIDDDGVIELSDTEPEIGI